MKSHKSNEYAWTRKSNAKLFTTKLITWCLVCGLKKMCRKYRAQIAKDGLAIHYKNTARLILLFFTNNTMTALMFVQWVVRNQCSQFSLQSFEWPIISIWMWFACNAMKRTEHKVRYIEWARARTYSAHNITNACADNKWFMPNNVKSKCIRWNFDLTEEAWHVCHLFMCVSRMRTVYASKCNG